MAFPQVMRIPVTTQIPFDKSGSLGVRAITAGGIRP